MEKTYPYPPSEGEIKWISTNWLREHIEDKYLTILDVQPNIQDYNQEHIPNAVYMDEGLLRAPFRGLPAVYVPPDYIQPIFCRLGLKSDVPVVVYTGKGVISGDGTGVTQTMVAYSLVRYGHNSVYVLDGGIDKWKKEGKPVTNVVPKVEQSDFKVEVHKEYSVSYEEFRSLKDRGDVMLLDVRSPQVYEGRDPRNKLGHIPGAINLPWTRFMNEENSMLLKSDEEIRSVINAYDATPDKTIICYCGSGRAATSEFTLFKWYLKYPKVKIYEGSFAEWTFYGNPTVTGKSPR